MTWVYGPSQYDLNQGDLFLGVPFHLPRGLNPDDDPTFEVHAGLLTSHGCDCERYDRAVEKGASQNVIDRLPLQVALVHDLAELDAGLAGDVREHRVSRYFYMPGDEEQPEQVADLWFEQPVPAVELVRLDRRATLSEEWRLKLIVQIWRLRSHLEEEDVFKEDWDREA